MKVALYARVSTNDQGQNPETQLYRLRQIANARGWEVHKEYIDFASGKNPNRPAFQRLMLDAKAGCFGILFVTRVDRFMRSTKNLYNTLEELERYHVVLECSEQDIHTGGAFGKFVLSFLSGLAEFERELTLERSKEGTARALAEGKLCHRPKGSKDTKPRKKRSDAGKQKGVVRDPTPLLSQPAENPQEVRAR